MKLSPFITLFEIAAYVAIGAFAYLSLGFHPAYIVVLLIASHLSAVVVKNYANTKKLEKRLIALEDKLKIRRGTTK